MPKETDASSHRKNYSQNNTQKSNFIQAEVFLLLVFEAGLDGLVVSTGALFGVSFLMAHFFLGVCTICGVAS